MIDTTGGGGRQRQQLRPATHSHQQSVSNKSEQQDFRRQFTQEDDQLARTGFRTPV